MCPTSASAPVPVPSAWLRNDTAPLPSGEDGDLIPREGLTPAPFYLKL